MDRSLSVFKIISIDYEASLGLLFPILFAGLNIAIDLIGGDNLHDALTSILIEASIFLLFVLWRIWIVSYVFREGMQVPALIKAVDPSFVHTEIEVTYKYAGKDYQVKNNVLPAARPDRFSAGQRVMILMVPRFPKQAVIQDLYLYD